jgi:hypothetical protein
MSKKTIFQCDFCNERIVCPDEGYEVGVFAWPRHNHACIKCAMNVERTLRLLGIRFEMVHPGATLATWGVLTVYADPSRPPTFAGRRVCERPEIAENEWFQPRGVDACAS